MRLSRGLLALAAAALLGGCAARSVVPTPTCGDCRLIDDRLKAGKAAGQRLEMPRTAQQFYRDRRPAGFAWSTEGCLLSRADHLMDVLRRADVEGLNPAEYHLRALERLRKKWPDPAEGPAGDALAADMDLLLTDAYLLYASHLLGGHTNLGMARAQWSIIRQKADIADLLSGALDSNQIAESLQKLVPPHAGYAALRAALDRYRRLARAGRWTAISDGPLLKGGEDDPRVPAIRSRLALEELRDPPTTSTTTFDAALTESVKRFQTARGLPPDGRIGADTLAAINFPVDDRINQIKFSMDRWRWLPFELGRRYIVVNIPEFRLFAFDKGKAALSLPVIVGKNNDDTATPVFSNQMTFLEFSPEWNVPPRIAVEEMLPAVQRDPGYLARNHLEVLVSSKGVWAPVNPTSIAWSSVTVKGFPYRFRQTPGPWNGLGAVKFMFPNEYNVYIHGNAESGLFDRRLRMFSHGCVRLDNPMKLAKWVLNDPDWTMARLRQYMNHPQPVVVPLGEPVPVYLVYFTAWVDGEGRLNFRDDIYGRDRDMQEKFYQRAATPASKAKTN